MRRSLLRRAAVLALLWAAIGTLAVCGAQVVLLLVDTTINPVTRDYILRGLDEAQARHADLVIIELDTAGGLAESMRDIIAAELASPIPIAVYVSPSGARAASAGALIALAADIAAMAPATHIGAAHPVDMLGSSTDDHTTAEKAVNDAAALARSIAEQRGRNIDWAEAAVRESSAVTASEALDLGVIDLIAPDRSDLIRRLDGWVLFDGRILSLSAPTIDTVRPNLRERLLGLLADPNLVYILFILGLYGLIYEFFSPGVGFGLAIGGLCLLLALFGLQILPVNIVGVALTIFGMGLIVLDAFTPTNGILTAGGIVALFAGALTLFGLPGRQFGLSWATVLAVIGVTGGLALFVVSKGLLIQRARPATGPTALVGRTGTAREVLSPTGRVFIHGEYWNARAASGRIESGDRVRVESVERDTLVVRRDESQGGSE